MTASQTSTVNAKSLQKAGVFEAYTKFRNDVIRRYNKKEPVLFADEYEDLAKIQAAETALYCQITKQTWQETKVDKKGKTFRIHPEISPETRKAIYSELKQHDFLTFAIACFGRDIIENKGRTEGEDDLDGMPYHLCTELNSLFDNNGIENQKIAEAVVNKIRYYLPQEKWNAFSTTLEKCPSLRDENKGFLQSLTSDQIVNQLAFEAMFARGGTKTPEDLQTLLSLSVGVPSLEKSHAKLKQKITPGATNDNPGEDSWQAKMGYGALGTALMVIPALIPQDNSKKLTFRRVASVAAAVILPTIGLLFLLRAATPGGIQMTR